MTTNNDKYRRIHFAVMAIENGARKLGISGKEMHDRLSKQGLIQNRLIKLPLPSTDTFEHIYHVFAVRCEERDTLEKYLSSHGIETVKHYPTPIHMQKAYKDLGIRQGELPMAEEISRTILSIPMYYGMAEEEIGLVVDVLNGFEGI